MRSVRNPVARRATCAALALALASEVQIAHAGDAPAHAVGQVDRGHKAFDDGDYVEAARLWYATVKLMPESDKRARARLVMNAATALELDFDTSGVRKNLENSRTFVVFYGEQIDAAYPDAAERTRERARVRDRLARIDAKLATPEAAALPPPKPVELTSADEEDEEDDGSQMADRLKRKHRAMIGGGVLLTMVGVGGLGMLAAGELTDRRWLTYTGVGTAIVFGVVGPVMIGFGIRRKRRALSASAPTTPRFGFAAGRSGGGISLSGRF